MTKVQRYDMRLNNSRQPMYSDMVKYDDYKLLEEERDALKRNLHEMRKLRNVQWKRAIEAERRIVELEADLLFADEQAKKLEEALEPHIIWLGDVHIGSKTSIDN